MSLRSSNFNSVSAVRLTATPRCAGGQVSALHCQQIAAELTFRNQVSILILQGAKNLQGAKPDAVPRSRFLL
jgi:hypothetical protein